MNPLSTAAARNNAEWCDAVSRSHGIHGTFGEAAWTSTRRTPPYYPDAVTLHPGAAPADLLDGIDTASPGASVKDGFATLDLTPHGFSELFRAHWIHRAAEAPMPSSTGLCAEHVRSPVRLRDWQAAWHGGDGVPDVFRPALLNDASVQVTAVMDGAEIAGGAVLNRSPGVVGLSNLFAVDGTDVGAVWSCVLSAAADRFPGLPIVGYEHGDDLRPALDSGFTPLGPLRVWLHDS